MQPSPPLLHSKTRTPPTAQVNENDDGASSSASSPESVASVSSRGQPSAPSHCSNLPVKQPQLSFVVNNTCVLDQSCMAIFSLLSQSHARDAKYDPTNLFDERRYCVNSSDEFPQLTMASIRDWLVRLFDKSQGGLTVCHSITACVLLERLVGYRCLEVSRWNWRLVMLVSIMLADKIIEDDPFCKKDFLALWESACTGSAVMYSLRRRGKRDGLTQLELGFCVAIDWRLVVQQGEFEAWILRLTHSGRRRQMVVVV